MLLNLNCFTDILVSQILRAGKAYQLFNQCGTNVISEIKEKIDDYLQDYLGKQDDILK